MPDAKDGDNSTSETRGDAPKGASPSSVQEPPIEDDQGALCRWIAHRHLLSVSFRCDPPPDPEGDSIVLAFSGFLLEWRGEWFLVTAGHVLCDLEHRLSKGWTLHHCRINDAFDASQSCDTNGIPFEYHKSERTDLMGAIGQDIGLIHLSQNTRSAMEANGKLPFEESTWRALPDDFEACAVMGLPSELQKHSSTPSDDLLEYNVVLVPFQDTDAVPAVLRKDAPHIYGAVAKTLRSEDGLTLTDMDGLSGGPLIGFRRNEEGQWTYWLRGVQSSWERRSRTLCVSPTSELSKWMSSVEKEYEERISRSPQTD